MSTSDVGSLPARTQMEVIEAGATRSGTLLRLLGFAVDDYNGFRDEVVSAFVDKLKAGVEVPNYPQFRDMNEMYFSLMEGFEKANGGLAAVGTVKARQGASIPEVDVLKRESSRVRDESGRDRVGVKVCVTGPYTLASFFQGKTPTLFRELGEAIGDILDRSLFRTRRSETAHVCVDEPVLGFLNDPLLDYGSEGREALRRAWEHVYSVASSRGADTSIHLHNTSENLFWEVEHLDTVASHVGDPLYEAESTRRRLEETDKTLWAAVAVTQYDNLIHAHFAAEGFKGNMPEKIGETWTGIKKGLLDPFTYLEDSTLMAKRLDRIIGFFGADRVRYVAPECGLNSFPSYETAMECLRRVTEAAGRASEG